MDSSFDEFSGIDWLKDHNASNDFIDFVKYLIDQGINFTIKSFDMKFTMIHGFMIHSCVFTVSNKEFLVIERLKAGDFMNYDINHFNKKLAFYTHGDDKLNPILILEGSYDDMVYCLTKALYDPLFYEHDENLSSKSYKNNSASDNVFIPDEYEYKQYNHKRSDIFVIDFVNNIISDYGR